MHPIEDRKKLEAEFHDRRIELTSADPKEYERITRNFKYYSVNRSSQQFFNKWLDDHCQAGTVALDFCCGLGQSSLLLAERGCVVTGIDISPESIERAKQLLKERAPGAKAQFLVADAERTELPPCHFDIIICNGVLHHLDLDNAFRELARLLKPEGRIFCIEALAHNPVIHMYRRLTPHMRTAWEVDHIMTRKSILSANSHFTEVELHFFHLLDIAAVPFRNTRLIFEPLLSALGTIDRLLLSIPGLRWWAWQCLFVLSKPKITAHNAPQRKQ